MNKAAATKPHRRVARSSREILQLLAAFEKSGCSIKEFCISHDIGETTFHKWKTRYGRKDKDGQGAAGFIPLQMAPVVTVNDAALFAEVKGIKLYQPVAASYLKELLQ